MIDIYAVKLSERLENSIYNFLLECLPLEKQERVRRFYHWEDAHRAVLAEVLIRTIACRQLNLKNSQITFSKNEYGKPFLQDVEGFYFNLSHSGEWVVCAVDDESIGIDVEIIKPIHYDIARRFFSEEEYNDLILKNDSEQLPYFFTLWTLKESYIKALGKGLSMPLDSFSVRVKNNETIELKDPLQCNSFRIYEIDPGYKLAVCSKKQEFPGSIKIKDAVELYWEMLQFRP